MNDDILNQGINISDISSADPLSLDGDITTFGSTGDSTNDSFTIIEDDLPILDDKINDIIPDDDTDDVILGAKMCPTRHGCTGATNCNYDYASYPG